ncbi:translation initiation factor IF-2 associated domain-containing protein, partial [Sphingomonas sp.]|uniref:flagellar hook-length control protein FliK n=1 Tax=Sphingomonas sp. TaxID=28214 RepID=UPI00258C71BA
MSETDNEKPKLGMRAPLGLKRTVETGQVKQSFSHGRSNTVIVETKRRRVLGRPGEAAPAAEPTPVAAPAPAAEAPAPGTASAPAQAPVPLGAVPMTIGLRSLAGSNQFEIRLDPKDLGRIDVNLDIDKETGAVQARLVVDRPETLALLQRDAGTLQQALTQAGLN